MNSKPKFQIGDKIVAEYGDIGTVVAGPDGANNYCVQFEHFVHFMIMHQTTLDAYPKPKIKIAGWFNFYNWPAGPQMQGPYTTRTEALCFTTWQERGACKYLEFEVEEGEGL